ncbi:hypothetical protein RND71_029298 [Anisodus tanguticus]|uniref:EGF-like domain-containing protein n=1 Tax=Anisodus tanguticus TaxID=243964 RepID=A0AAE1RD61_9SOLA|nr:hypothetical protein RND71_029298 [Anisodus tanguticus]
MRSYTFGFALNVVVLGILIYVSIFNIATTADGSAGVFGADCKGALVPWLSLPPPPSPGHDGICNYVDCGKGKCVETGEFLGLGFKCVCNPGWKQIQLGTIVFPSCNVPNCVLGADCKGVELGGDPSSLPPPPPPGNGDIDIFATFIQISTISDDPVPQKKAESPKQFVQPWVAANGRLGSLEAILV